MQLYIDYKQKHKINPWCQRNTLRLTFCLKLGVNSQVHKARLADGREVAVKVQYPGLRGAANADLTTLSLLSAAAAALFPDFRLSWLYDELRLKLTEELGELG